MAAVVRGPEAIAEIDFRELHSGERQGVANPPGEAAHLTLEEYFHPGAPAFALSDFVFPEVFGWGKDVERPEKRGSFLVVDGPGGLLVVSLDGERGANGGDVVGEPERGLPPELPRNGACSRDPEV